MVGETRAPRLWGLLGLYKGQEKLEQAPAPQGGCGPLSPGAAGDSGGGCSWRLRAGGPRCGPPLQAVFRSNLSHLLELMGSGKESLIFMKKRTKRLTAQWALAAQRLAQKLGSVWRDQKQVLLPCAFRELSSQSLGNELRAPGLQVGTESVLEKVLLNLFKF